MIEQRWQPVARVGLYVPGGKAVYPSSVVMNVVPAQVAGVTLDRARLAAAGGASAAGCTPPIAGVAALLGITEVYAMGGAGRDRRVRVRRRRHRSRRRCSGSPGPGNVFVAAAKRLVQGVTGIDAEAGPTDILVIADDTADPDFVAADLVSQAEHDELAAAVLVTDSPELAARVRRAARVARSRHEAQRPRASRPIGGAQSALVLVDDLAQAADFATPSVPSTSRSRCATPRPRSPASRTPARSSSGAYSPVSLGDYAAGSNHVLPTGGQARYAAGLSARARSCGRSRSCATTRQALREVAPVIAALSTEEDLPAHGEAVTARFDS